MLKWKDITRLSDQEACKREAAFEAEMLAALQVDEPRQPATAPPPEVRIRDGIQITVTENGHTTYYRNLETVPAPVRQRILNVWQPPRVTEPSSPLVGSQPPPTSVPRRKSLRFAMSLNLLLPGLGQFCVGQKAVGSVYVVAFIACFVTALVKFLSAYFEYLQFSTSSDILSAGNLEQLTHTFPTGTLVGLAVASIAIYRASSIHLALSHCGK